MRCVNNDYLHQHTHRRKKKIIIHGVVNAEDKYDDSITRFTVHLTYFHQHEKIFNDKNK